MRKWQSCPYFTQMHILKIFGKFQQGSSLREKSSICFILRLELIIISNKYKIERKWDKSQLIKSGEMLQFSAQNNANRHIFGECFLIGEL